MKKIYIIGSNPNDFFDLTLQSFKILSKSNLIILSKKFNNNFFKILTDNNKKFLIEEEIVPSTEQLQKEIYKLFSKYNKIAHLIVGDSYLFSENENERFFKMKKIEVEKFLGIPEIINYLNNKKYFLTNRKRNSSVIFFSPLSEIDCEKLLSMTRLDKLVIKIPSKLILENILKILKKNDFKSFNYRIFFNSKELKSEKNIKLIGRNNYLYIILEHV